MSYVIIESSTNPYIVVDLAKFYIIINLTALHDHGYILSYPLFLDTNFIPVSNTYTFVKHNI